MVGSAALICLSSVTFPSAIGTLKSTRMSTRLPLMSISLTDFFVIPVQSLGHNETGTQVKLCTRHNEPHLVFYKLFAIFAVRSAVRQAYPHSLSYQATTLTIFPITSVSMELNTDEKDVPRRSVDTSGSSETSRIPFMGPWA